MDRDLYIDFDVGEFVDGINSTAIKSHGPFFKGDTETLNLYFLQQTGIVGTPYAFADKSNSTVKMSLGTPAQATLLSVTGFTAIPTSVTASITRTQTGSSSQNEIQKLSFSKVPQTGFVQITSPSIILESSLHFGAIIPPGNFSHIILDNDINLIASAFRLTENIFYTRAVFNGITGSYCNLVSGQEYVVRTTGKNNQYNKVELDILPIASETSGSIGSLEPKSWLCKTTGGGFLHNLNSSENTVLISPGTITGSAQYGNVEFTAEIAQSVVGITAGVQYWTIPVNGINPAYGSVQLSTTDPATSITILTGFSKVRPIYSSFTISAETSAKIECPITPEKLEEKVGQLRYIGASNVQSYALNDKEFALEFTRNREFQPVPLLTVTNNTAAAPGFTATIGITSAAITTLLSGTTSAQTTLEVELTTGGNKLTAAQGDATLVVPLSH